MPGGAQLSVTRYAVLGLLPADRCAAAHGRLMPRHSAQRLARFSQELGWYDPLKKETNLNAPAIKKWLEVGAQPSDTVENLLKKALILPLKRD